MKIQRRVVRHTRFLRQAGRNTRVAVQAGELSHNRASLCGLAILAPG
jgi:hypothetical protein